MNPTLRELLSIAGIDSGRGARTGWSRIVLLENWGGVPPLRRLANTYVGNRGFNFLLLGPGGMPTHFCKCRPASGMQLRNELAVLTTLSRDPSLSTAVPRTWGVRSGGLELLISTYIPGTRFDRTVARLSTEKWAVAMTEILDLAHRVAQRAVETLPDLAGRSGRICLYEAGRGSLARLESMGLGRRSVRSLEDALRAGAGLQGFPQHGDLWPGNVVRSGEGWWLLDYEVFSQVQVPLYDACHFVRTCSDLRRARGTGPTASLWIDRLLADGTEAAACWHAIASVARHHALSPSEVVGALVYYLIEVTAQFQQRRGPQWYWESHAREVQRLADIFASGGQLDLLIAERLQSRC